MKITKSITAENQWSTKFELLGDAHAATKPARALVCATSDASTVTLRRYASDGTTVTASIDLDSAMTAVEIPVTGTYDVGCPTGGYGGTPFTVTVEQ